MKKEDKCLLSFSRQRTRISQILIAFVMLFCGGINVSAQNSITIKGQVVDEIGEPLIGVGVLEKNTTNGAITDMDGNYTVQNLSSSSTLSFTYVGFVGQEIKVGSQKEINIVLNQDLQVLDEVVVVGYGTQKKQTLTGAVAAITSDQLKTTKSDNIDNMITGKIPGVRVIQKSGEPGEYNTVFQIRGMENPLFVVDGVPRDGMNRIDPSEVESISVLKDASAAIYGVRAANGVVLVTTKRGVSGKAKLEYNGTFGWQKATDMPKSMNAVEYMTLMNENAVNNGRGIMYHPNDFNAYLSGEKQSTNWSRLGVDATAPQTQHSLNVTGGTDRVNYFLSFGYLKQEGFWSSGDLNYERFNIRSNIDVKITDRLKASVGIGGFKDTKNQPYRDNWMVYKSLWTQVPLLPVYANDDPNYFYNAADGDHPLIITNSDLNGYKQRRTSTLQTTFSLEYDIPNVDGLKAKAMYSYDYYTMTSKEFRKSYDLYNYNAENDEVYVAGTKNTPTQLRRYYLEKPNNLMQLSLSYDKTFADKHHLSVLALYEESKRKADNFWGQREFDIDLLDQLNAGNSSNQTSGQDGNLYELTNRAFIGRVNYEYDMKYLLELSFRQDGSSKFAKGDQWGFFPAGSLGWRVTEESFFKNIDALSFIDNLKPRASYGITGDDSASSYQFISGYAYPSGGYVMDGQYGAGIRPRTLANPNITWYKAKMLNVGIDIDMWRGLLGLEVDYFTRKRTGLLANRASSLPGTIGADFPQENLNSDRTSGFELAVNHRNKIRDFSYTINGNISYTRTKLLHQESSGYGNSYDYWRNDNSNRWNDIWWGKGYEGQFTSPEQPYQHAIQDGKGNSIYRPGDYIYEDWNGDGVIDQWDEKPIAYRTKNDESYPHLNFGFTIGAEYKGFDLTALFQGAARSNTRYPEQLEAPLSWDRNGLAMFMDRWHQADMTDPNSEWIPGHYPSTNRGETTNYIDSERSVQDAKYLRMKSLEFGYTIPRKLVQNVGIERVRVYFTGYNMLTWTSIKHLDPERPSATWGYLYPLTKTYNFGLNVSF